MLSPRKKIFILPICGQRNVSIAHILLECPHTRPIWLGRDLALTINVGNYNDVKEWWTEMHRQLGRRHEKLMVRVVI